MTSQQHRKYASEYLQAAENTGDPETKLSLVGLARARIWLAELAEDNCRTDVVYETAQKSPQAK